MIYYLGDSHVSIFGGDARILSPSFTAMSSNYNKMLLSEVQAISQQFDKTSDYLLLCFGEIDIRMHISKLCIKNGEMNIDKVHEMVDMVAKEYMKTITKYGEMVFGRIIISLPTASFLPPEDATENVYGTNEQRNLITSIFNKKLSEVLTQNNIKHLSIFEDMIDENMRTKKECIEGGGGLNNIHPNRSMSPIASKKLFDLIKT
jgi:hypothetical protein